MIKSKKLFLFCLLLAICVFSAAVAQDEDDMELNDEQTSIYTGKSKTMSEKITAKYKWPKRPKMPYHIIVPVQIREEDFTEEALDNFRAGLKDIEEKTCVRFVDPKPKHQDFIFVHDDGSGKCNSKLGRVGGKQPLKLKNDCMLVRKKCVHEVMHALGFTHMHQRFDRDDAVIIHYDNLDEKDWRQFDKLNNEWEAYNTPYDVYSCMHYAKKGFSKNKKITVETINPDYQDIIGEQFTLSKGDAKRIKRMYRCGLPPRRGEPLSP